MRGRTNRLCLQGKVALITGASGGQGLAEARLNALASTGMRRSASFPDLPTIAESALPAYEASTWAGVLVPAGSPTAVVKRLHAELTRILDQREIREKLASLAFEPVGSSPADFAATIRREIVKWSKVVRESGAKAE